MSTRVSRFGEKIWSKRRIDYAAKSMSEKPKL